MNFTLTMAPEHLSWQLDKVFDSLRQPAQAAMADVYKGVVDANFGSEGFDRPWPWEPLSPPYSKRVGRDFATLFVSGALKATVEKDSSDAEASSVSMGNTGLVAYAMAHHHGYSKNNLPARRVFPLTEDNSTTDKTMRLVTQAACEAIERSLSK